MMSKWRRIMDEWMNDIGTSVDEMGSKSWPLLSYIQHLEWIDTHKYTPDPHELWAAAQLMPGEGIEDGVKRIEELLEGDVGMAEQAWKSYNKLKAEGKIPADLDCGTTTSGVKVSCRTGQQWREYER